MFLSKSINSTILEVRVWTQVIRKSAISNVQWEWDVQQVLLDTIRLLGFAISTSAEETRQHSLF